MSLKNHYSVIADYNDWDNTHSAENSNKSHVTPLSTFFLKIYLNETGKF